VVTRDLLEMVPFLIVCLVFAIREGIGKLVKLL
jgi:hypothetical protein